MTPGGRLLRSLTLVALAGCSAILGIDPAKVRPDETAGSAGQGNDGGDGGSTQGGSSGANGTGGKAGTTGTGGSTGKGGTAGTAGAAGAGGCDPDEAPGDGIFVSPAGSDDDGDGSPESPAATIARGLELLADGDQARLVLDQGTYAEAVELGVEHSGAVIEGGWVRSEQGDWTRVCAASARNETIIASPTNVGVRVTRLTDPGGLRTLTVTTDDRAASANGESGESNYGVFVTGPDTAFSLEDVVVITGDASAGGTPASGPTATPPVCTALTTSGGCGTGANGTNGEPGPSASDGTFDADGYVPGDASSGEAGESGHNGAVGGMGTPADCFPGGCNCVGGSCGTTGNRARRVSENGLCGCGGVAGRGGGAGLGGGASVGVFASGDGVVVTIVGSTIRSGGGGNGSAGSTGGTGMSGELGRAGNPMTCLDDCVTNPPDCTNAGCRQTEHQVAGGLTGGDGGDGGDGGLGGGGSGGPSYAVVVVAGAGADTDSESMLEPGPPGTGRGDAPNGLSGPILRD